MTRYLLGDLVRNCKEKVDRDNNPYEYFVAGDHMETERPRLTMRGRFDEADVGPAFIRLFRPGQVLYGSRRTYLKKVSVADFEGVTSNVTFVLETKDEEVLPQRLLPFLLLSDRFTSYSIGKSKGSTNPYVLFSDLADFEVDLPGPVRVAEIADVMCAAEQVKENYRSLLAACDDVVKSQFVEMFGGPEVFEAAPNTVKDVAKLRVGIVIKPSRFYAATGTGTPAFRSLNIGPMRVQNSDWIEFTDEAMRVNTRTVAHEGDVLIVRSGYPGTSCVVTAEFAGRNVVDLIIATPDRDKILPEYLCAYLNCPPGKSQIERMQHGVAQQHFNVGMCEKLRLCIPPLSHQKEFADFTAQVDKSKFAVQKALDELNATTKKILNQELGLGDV